MRTPSAQVCSALARALRLSDEEHAHLLRMAGHAADPGRVPRVIPASLHRIMGQLARSPLAIYDATWQLLYWNPLFAAAFGDPTLQPVGERNVLVWQFLGELPRVRQSADERAAFEESLVADLRSTTSRYPDDPDLATLIARLKRSPRFGRLWERGSVGGHERAQARRASGRRRDRPELRRAHHPGHEPPAGGLHPAAGHRCRRQARVPGHCRPAKHVHSGIEVVLAVPASPVAPARARVG